MKMTDEMNSKVEKLSERIYETFLEVSDGSHIPDKEYIKEVAKALLYGVNDGSVFGSHCAINGLDKLI